MTEQPPSAEALQIALRVPFGQPEDRRVQSIAKDIDALCEKRVSAETERCAQIALQYRDEVDAGEHAGLGDPERALGQGYAANLIGKRIRAPAERATPRRSHYEGCPHETCQREDCYSRCMDEQPPSADPSAERARAIIGIWWPCIEEEARQPIAEAVYRALSALASERDAVRTKTEAAFSAALDRREVVIRDVKAERDAALARLSALASERDAALQAAPSPSGVDYTERARSMLEQWMREWGGETRPYAGSMMMDLQMRVAAAFSAVASEREAALQAARDAVENVPSELWIDRRNSETIAQAIAPDFAEFASAVASEREAAAIRAFAKRVWSDTEEVAYQAGVSDTLERLLEPGVREAVKAALEQGRPHWITGVGAGGSGLGGMADAAIAKIAEMLK